MSFHGNKTNSNLRWRAGESRQGRVVDYDGGDHPAHPSRKWWRLVTTTPYTPPRRGDKVRLPAGQIGYVTEVARQLWQTGAHVRIGHGMPVFYPLTVIATVADSGGLEASGEQHTTR